MLKTGDHAPDFTLTNQAGESVSLSGLLATGPAVVYFYPADSTPGCTQEACNFRDRHAALQAAGLSLVGISPQSAESKAEFAAKHELPFDLLADEDRRVIKAYGAVGPFGIGVRRVSYLIEPDGTIADLEAADLLIGRHDAFAERVLARYRAAGS